MPKAKVSTTSPIDAEVEKEAQKILGPDFIDFEDNKVLRSFRKDLSQAALKMGRQEAQLIVKYYYQFQLDRIRTNNRIVAFNKNQSEPVACLGFFNGHLQNLEKLMIVPLKQFVLNNPTGQWLIQRKGIGPVLAAGLLAHLCVKRTILDKETGQLIEQTFPKVSSWWRFGGYDPTLKWEKGKKRPWNADLKVIFFKVGKSIVMTGSGDLYRSLYDQRKQYAVNKNLAGGYRESASEILAKINRSRKLEEENEIAHHIEHDVNEATEDDNNKEKQVMVDYLRKGMLSPAIIDAQSRRWTVCMLLSHMHTVMQETEMHTPAMIPYALAHLDPNKHHEMIPVPDYVPLKERHLIKDCPPNGIYIRKK